MLPVLRQRNFALLWTGGLISLMGDRVLMMALPFFVYEETGSTPVSVRALLSCRCSWSIPAR